MFALMDDEEIKEISQTMSVLEPSVPTSNQLAFLSNLRISCHQPVLLSARLTTERLRPKFCRRPR
ncbi:hypothetical protein [Thalassospira alkalitolerans]|uniref:hypothetical protein n=1 Tax=Thalassospira alkalitolerans TaxID=1293890 RepID=UPI003AA9540B